MESQKFTTRIIRERDRVIKGQAFNTANPDTLN